MDIFPGGIPSNPLRQCKWKGGALLLLVPAEIQAWPHHVGLQSTTQATAVV